MSNRRKIEDFTFEDKFVLFSRICGLSAISAVDFMKFQIAL